MQRIIREVVDLGRYMLPVLLFMTLSYSLYLVVADRTVCILGDEDELFEYLTALFFLAASWFFLRSFLARKNAWFLLLSIVFFVGFGEEISWGQRILQFETPDALAEVNVQNEFSFHNIELFNAHDFDHNLKAGPAKLLTVNFLYKLFWLAYCVLLPLACVCARPIASLVDRIRLPIPAVPIGMLFLVNWVVFKATSVFLLSSGKIEQYYDTIGEMRECVSAFIFMVVAVYFLDLKCPRQATAADRSATVLPSSPNKLLESG